MEFRFSLIIFVLFCLICPAQGSNSNVPEEVDLEKTKPPFRRTTEILIRAMIPKENQAHDFWASCCLICLEPGNRKAVFIRFYPLRDNKVKVTTYCQNINFPDFYINFNENGTIKNFGEGKMKPPNLHFKIKENGKEITHSVALNFGEVDSNDSLKLFGDYYSPLIEEGNGHSELTLKLRTLQGRNQLYQDIRIHKGKAYLNNKNGDFRGEGDKFYAYKVDKHGKLLTPHLVPQHVQLDRHKCFFVPTTELRLSCKVSLEFKEYKEDRKGICLTPNTFSDISLLLKKKTINQYILTAKAIPKKHQILLESGEDYQCLINLNKNRCIKDFGKGREAPPKLFFKFEEGGTTHNIPIALKLKPIFIPGLENEGYLNIFFSNGSPLAHYSWFYRDTDVYSFNSKTFKPTDEVNFQLNFPYLTDSFRVGRGFKVILPNGNRKTLRIGAKKVSLQKATSISPHKWYLFSFDFEFRKPSEEKNYEFSVEFDEKGCLKSFNETDKKPPLIYVPYYDNNKIFYHTLKICMGDIGTNSKCRLVLDPQNNPQENGDTIVEGEILPNGYIDYPCEMIYGNLSNNGAIVPLYTFPPSRNVSDILTFFKVRRIKPTQKSFIRFRGNRPPSLKLACILKILEGIGTLSNQVSPNDKEMNSNSTHNPQVGNGLEDLKKRIPKSLLHYFTPYLGQ